ncbi:MAG: hypothetical protein QOE97_3956 [Pseudonocardiales bacterium]|nr:hypothetical protein [Pseudonocardiales bacterium]
MMGFGKTRKESTRIARRKTRVNALMFLHPSSRTSGIYRATIISTTS